MLLFRLALARGGPAAEPALTVIESPLVLIWSGAARAAVGATAVMVWGRRRLALETTDAARLAGVTGLRRTLLMAGLMRGPLIAAFLLAAALALGELGAAVFISPPGWELLPVRVFNMMHYQHGGQVAALALLTTGAAAIFGALAVLLASRKRHA